MAFLLIVQKLMYISNKLNKNKQFPFNSMLMFTVKTWSTRPKVSIAAETVITTSAGA